MMNLHAMRNDSGSWEVNVAEVLCNPDVLILDTRSPTEFAQGHMPRAHNLPLFDNDERATIGTLYKKSGKEHAIDQGLAFIGPKLLSYVQSARELVAAQELSNPQVVVHCWRGGMRSESVTWLLRLAGISARKMENGYKGYRRHMRQWMTQPLPLQVLAGSTGSGKTPVLRALADMGMQVLDLERLAGHLGSAFGNLSETPQPSSEQFSNDCFDVLLGFDLKRPIWLEDESRRIGNVHLPESLYQQIKQAEVHLLHRSWGERLEEVLRVYGDEDMEPLKAAFRRIAKKLGGQNVQRACESLEEGNLQQAAELALLHYDKQYAHTMQRHNRLIASHVQGEGKDFFEIAQALRDL